ncbi:ATP synthase F1 subunit delta [Desulfovibrio psychrotolerans]|uniref:ATP synthase subunit delta n=1 Tax=Desulfovibrio psychrotolerans TaxID=415242 RepID=A0A7J0BTS1_9BACT|nr:ATP synthase F1 subunit delta [Desulfovibrio psychrotolerans]GFM37068.1 ATP synthase subunit delta [Desulfovibrio psychrotolerans]
MIGNIVARRYARALFSIGKKAGAKELDSFGQELANLANAIEVTPELGKVFRNPIFSLEEKRAVISKVLDGIKASQTIRNFCFLLAEKDRLALIPDIQAFYNILLDAEQGVVRGELITAIELPKAKRDEVKSQLEKQANQKLILDFSVNKGILGGVLLKIGDQVLDASLRAQLGILKENIKRGE